MGTSCQDSFHNWVPHIHTAAYTSIQYIQPQLQVYIQQHTGIQVYKQPHTVRAKHSFTPFYHYPAPSVAYLLLLPRIPLAMPLQKISHPILSFSCSSPCYCQQYHCCCFLSQCQGWIGDSRRQDHSRNSQQTSLTKYNATKLKRIDQPSLKLKKNRS